MNELCFGTKPGSFDLHGPPIRCAIQALWMESSQPSVPQLCPYNQDGLVKTLENSLRPAQSRRPSRSAIYLSMKKLILELLRGSNDDVSFKRLVLVPNARIVLRTHVNATKPSELR